MITPLDVVAENDGESDDPLFVELQPLLPPTPPPEVGDGDVRELPLLLLLLLLLRDARLLARALIRLFKSSLSSDLSGET